MKKTMARSLALSTLMAFVITGSAMAAGEKVEVDDGSTVTKDAGEYAGVVNKNSDLTLKNDAGIVFNKNKVGDEKYAIHMSGTDENVAKTTITSNKITFVSTEKPSFSNNSNISSDYKGLKNFAAWLNGNTNLTINTGELYVGSEGMGDRGFQLKNKNNTLNINADKVVAYVGDGFINAQGPDKQEGNSVVNIGTADKVIGHFEAHSTFGKGDYGVALLQANEGNIVNLFADKAILDGANSSMGGVIGTGGWGTVNVTANDLNIDGNICGSYGGMNTVGKKALITVNAGTLNMTGDINVGSNGINNSDFSRDTEVNLNVAGQAQIKGDINVVGNNGKNANEKDNSVLNLTFNGNSVIDGDINVKGSDKNTNATVNLGGTGDMSASKGVFNVEKSGNVNFTGGNWAVNQWIGDGTGDVSVADDANVNVAGNMQVNTFALNGSTTLKGENVSINTNTLTGNNGVVNTDSLTNKIVADNASGVDGLTVHGNGAIADQIFQDKANADKLAGVVVGGADNAVLTDKVTTEEGVIGGAFEGTVDKDGHVVGGSQAKNTFNMGVSDMASVSLMAWRAENDDMNQRLGELRDSKGEHGIWTRMVKGESEYGAITNKYTKYELGYDEKLSTNEHWTVGAAISYTDGDSSFAKGSGENTHKGLSVYGSYLADDGSYVDLIAKYAKLEHEFDVLGGIGKGDYEANGYSVSAEYGKRFTKDNGFWLEPQVQLSYGKVGAVSYATANAIAEQDGMDSLVGRVGFRMGKDFAQGNVYAKASYLYDFDGETSVTMRKGSLADTYGQDLGGGWWEVGVGTNVALSDASYLYLDVERTYGGEVETPWQWNVGLRYSF